MKILIWDKPKKNRSTAEWENISFDGGPKGGYVPNMSEEDEQRWKAKLVGTKTGYHQIEIRKKAGDSLMTIIVSLGGGYNYKHYTVEGPYHNKTPEDFPSGYSKDQDEIDRYALIGRTTLGLNVHMSMNGPAQMTFRDMDHLQLAIAEARETLEGLEELPGLRYNYVAILDDTALTIPTRHLIDMVPSTKVNFVLPGNKPSGGKIAFSAPESVLTLVEKIPGIEAITSFDEARTKAQLECSKKWI